MRNASENNEDESCNIRQDMSALVGDLDLYPQVFQIQNAIPGSVWVSATG